jgi:hypothetical protein
VSINSSSCQYCPYQHLDLLLLHQSLAWLNAVDDLSGHLGRMACAVALAVCNASNLILSKAIIYHGLPGVGS